MVGGSLRPERVRLTPVLELPKRGDPGGEKPGTVLFVGDFSHRPNVDAARWLVEEIMPSLRGRAAGVRLLLVGRSAPGEIRDLSVADVEVVGEVPAIAPFLETAAVVIAPVRIGGGMRMKVLQALASGKAVVTTSRGAEGFTLVGDDPPFVVAEDADAIASETARLLDNPAARRALGERARAFAAEHFSADAYARRLEATYDQAISIRTGDDS